MSGGDPRSSEAFSALSFELHSDAPDFDQALRYLDEFESDDFESCDHLIHPLIDRDSLLSDEEEAADELGLLWEERWLEKQREIIREDLRFARELLAQLEESEPNATAPEISCSDGVWTVRGIYHKHPPTDRATLLSPYYRFSRLMAIGSLSDAGYEKHVG